MAHPTRIKGFDYRGQIRVFVTASTPFRHPAFADDSVATFVVHIPTVISKWKQLTGYHGRAKARPHNRLWQGNYMDRVLRAKDHMLQYVRYIVSDPVRSGIVDRLEDYQWIGSERWSREDLIEIAAISDAPYWWLES